MEDNQITRGYDISIPDCLINKILLELKSGKHLTALNYINKLLEIYPDNFKAYYLRANLLSLYRDKEGAIEDYDKCLTLKPDHLDAYINRGLTKKSLGDIEGSYSDFKIAGELGKCLI